MEVRQRRPLPSNGGSSEGDEEYDHDLRRSKGESIDRRFTVLILSSVFILSLGLASFQFAPQLLPSVLHEALDDAFEYLGVDQKAYAIILDAGSTGTRILTFAFHHNLISGDYKLEGQVFAQTTPGISSYAENPEIAAHSVLDLLKHAVDKVPPHKRMATPITLKATAGLRLLPSNAAQALLSSVNDILESSDFLNLGAEIMNPMEEGLYGWFTLNYLTRTLQPQHSDLVCLDLGGGSTQITFSPSSSLESLIQPWMKKSQFIHRVRVLKKEVNLYSHSYLGLGILSFRKALFKDASRTEVVASPCMGRNEEPLHHAFQDFNYTLVGDPEVVNPYEACLELTRSVLKEVRVHQPSEIQNRRVAAFSYFFDRGLERGLIPQGSTEGSIRVQDFTYAAKTACNEEKDLHKFHCLDLTYISSLLLDGYGFPGSKEIHLYKKIEGYEVSWGLGVAYTLLDTHA